MDPQQKPRVQRLVEKAQQIVNDVAKEYTTQQFEQLVKDTTVEPDRLRSHLFSFLNQRVEKYIIQKFNKDIPQLRIQDLETVNTRGWDRRAQFGSHPWLAPPEEQPVNISTLSTEQITDAKCQNIRRRWLNELKERQIQADKMLENLNREAEVINTETNDTLASLRTRLQSVNNSIDKICEVSLPDAAIGAQAQTQMR